METNSIFKIMDFTLVLGACSLAYFLRFDSFGMTLPYFLPATILAVSSTYCLSITGFYSNQNSFLDKKALYSVTTGFAVAAVITATMLYFTKTGENFSRLWLVVSVSLSCLFVIITRSLLRQILKASMGERGILLIGGNATALKVSQLLSDKSSSHGLSLSRRFELSCSDSTSHQIDFLDEIQSFIESQRDGDPENLPISECWITHDVFSSISHMELENALVSNSAVKLVYIPEFPNIAQKTQESIEHIFGVPTINSDFSKRHRLMQAVKLLEDQMIAWTALVVLSPLLLAVSAAIKLDSPGPIFYRQSRYGYGGKEFRIWKFRSMKVTEKDQQFVQATKNDPRITRLGRALRQSSIDELPQIFNVINGAMSLVGPRPHPVLLNEQHRTEIDKYMLRHAVKPGITGLAQIRGYRGETETKEAMQKRIHYDLQYVREWTPFLDLRIILLTVVHLLKSENAY